MVKTAIENQNYKFLIKILSADLPNNIYKQAYVYTASDQDAKDIIWKQIAPTQMLSSQILRDNTVADITGNF